MRSARSDLNAHKKPDTRGPLCGPFGGFLLLTAFLAAHFTGDPGVSPPLVRTLIAATRSALSAKSHVTQAKAACDFRLSLQIWPQDGHVREVSCAGTELATCPGHLVLKLSQELGPALVKYRPIEPRLCANVSSPLFDCTAPRPDIFFTCKSSTTTIAWLLLMVVEVLCR